MKPKTTRARCTATVEECTNPDCLWRGGNRPDRPCTQCGSTVIARPCRRYPNVGQTKCQSHGGATPNGLAAGAHRLAEHHARVAAGELAALLEHHDRPDQHPTDGLLEGVRYLGRMARALTELATQLDLAPEWQIIGDLRVLANNPVYGPDHQGDGKPHVLLEMARVWTNDYAKACKLALDAGIDERRLHLAENEIDQLQQAVMIGLAAADLDADQQARFTTGFVEALRGLTA